MNWGSRGRGRFRLNSLSRTSANTLSTMFLHSMKLVRIKWGRPHARRRRRSSKLWFTLLLDSLGVVPAHRRTTLNGRLGGAGT